MDYLTIKELLTSYSCLHVHNADRPPIAVQCKALLVEKAGNLLISRVKFLLSLINGFSVRRSLNFVVN